MKVPDVHSQGEKINSPIWRVEFDIYSPSHIFYSPVASSQAFFASAEYNKAYAEVKLTFKASEKNRWQETTANLNLYREGNKAWGILQNLAGDKWSSNPKPMEDHGTTISSDRKKVSRATGLTDHEKESIKQLKMQEKAPTVTFWGRSKNSW